MSTYAKVSIFIATVVVFVIFATLFLPDMLTAHAAAACADDNERQEEQIQCWLELMRTEIKENGVKAGMKLFAHVYDTYPAFATTGCHLHAHRVGDIVYYEHYLEHRDFDALELPQETANCGYGFYHGFFEHLIQDAPDPSYITDTCNYFHERLGDTLRDIRQICYHGSGHGLALARVEEVSDTDWGVASAYMEQPLLKCDELAEATVREKEECREGVYNVLVDWMETEQYGFDYNDASPFAVCDDLRSYDWKKACYYEMAQKLDRLAARDPEKLTRVLAPVSDPQLRRTAFLVGIAGMIQPIANTDESEMLMRQCTALGDAFRSDCVTAVASGLFEHGPPQNEYVRAMRACRLPEISDTGTALECWRVVASKLERFYSPERTDELCKSIPAEFQSLCTRKE